MPISNVKKLWLFLLGCLVALGARAVFVWLNPSGNSPIKDAAEFSGELGRVVTACCFLLFATQIGNALILAHYNVARANDLLGSWVIWLMAATRALKGFAFLCLAISVWWPMYRAWAVATILTAIISVPALIGYRRDMKALLARDPMKDLEALTVDLRAARRQQKPAEEILSDLEAQMADFLAKHAGGA